MDAVAALSGVAPVARPARGQEMAAERDWRNVDKLVEVEAAELQKLLRTSRAATEAPAQQSTALRIAQALGWCVLFAEPTQYTPHVLPVAVCRVAVPAAVRWFGALERAARRLPKRWDEAQSAEERDNLCVEALIDRTCAQGTYVALSESLTAALERTELAVDEYEQFSNELSVALEKYDEELRAHLELLSSVAEHELVISWRKHLRPPYAEAPPWWLSETLLQVAEAIARQTDRDLAALGTLMGEAPLTGVMRFSSAVASARPRERPRSEPLEYPAEVITPTVSASRSRVPLRLRWLSPDGDYMALCVLPYPPEPLLPVRVVFFEVSNAERATGLSGRTARLAGVRATIGADAACMFEVDALRRALAAGERLRLYVEGSRGYAAHLRYMMATLDRSVPAPLLGKPSSGPWVADPAALDEVRRQIGSTNK